MPDAPRFVPLEFERLPEDEQLARSRRFLASMRRRRTVREFAREPVPYELVENAIATAGTAPSGAHQQPWTFVVVSDPDVKRRIRAAAEAEERRSYESRMPDEWLEALRPLGTDWRKAHLEDAPYLVVVFEQAYGVRADGSRVKHYYVRESVGIAAACCSPACTRPGSRRSRTRRARWGSSASPRTARERAAVRRRPRRLPGRGMHGARPRAEAGRGHPRAALSQAAVSGSRVSSRVSKSRRIDSPLESTVS